MDEHDLTFFHSPKTRSTGVRVLLEELGAPYRLHPVNMKAGDQRKAAFLAVNPMGKVPAIRHRDAVVTEQGAIYLYLGDLFPEAGLAPAIGDPLRGPYLRWLVFYGSSFEPAMVDKALKREPGSPGMSPYGDVETTLSAVIGRLRAGPYMLGERFSTADLLWGGALGWMTMFGIVEKTPEIAAYVERVCSRPSFAKVSAADDTLAAEHEAAAKAVG